jgi:hypothetical protein
METKSSSGILVGAWPLKELYSVVTKKTRIFIFKIIKTSNLNRTEVIQDFECRNEHPNCIEPSNLMAI